MTNYLFDGLFENMSDLDKTFIEVSDRTSPVSYREFLGETARLANLLKSAGVAEGDRVAVQVQKSVTALAVYFATVRAGAVFLPLNIDYRKEEVSYFLADAKPKIFVCDGAAAENYSDMSVELGMTLLTLNADETGSLADLAAEQSVEFQSVNRGVDDLAALVYTSGTTGRSKGAMVTHGNLLSNAKALSEEWHFEADDVLLHALPIFHVHGLFIATNTVIAAGASMVFLPKFDAATALEQLPNVTVLMGVPTFYTRLLNEPRFDKKTCANMRLFISGSAPLLAETHRQFEAQTGHAILERYGMSETNINTSNPYVGDRVAGTVGLPLSGVAVRISDPESGEMLEQGNIGMIEISGPNVFKGYWQMPEKTTAEFRSDGFFMTGDLGLIDERGYVSIVGRGKDLIITGGYNVYPKEIELIVDAVDGVVESAVIGLPHSDFGETVVAIVVQDGSKKLSEADVVGAIDAKIARFKQPKKIIFLSELPRNTMGKVQKNKLREQFSNLFD